MRFTPLEQKVATIVAPVVIDAGFDLVCVKIIGEGGSRNVQIMAENPQTRRLGVEDCARISKAVSAIMDVEDPINGPYRLEVSSPGIDRQLLRRKDFEDFSGLEARVELDAPIDVVTGQKKFQGKLNGLKDDLILMTTENGDVELPLSGVTKAKLVLTDALIKATAKNIDEQNKSEEKVEG
mgnify:CR=1 FL=1